VDAIYHNGAQVNYVFTYAQLKQTNIGGTQEAVRLAEADDIPLHYVSTLRLFDHRNDARPIREDDPLDLETIIAGSGYAHTKAMGERLISAAAKRGLKTTIMRPGLLWGNGVDGIPNENDAISRLVRGCIELHAAPVSDLQVNLTSVSYASAGLIALSEDPDCFGNIWHLVYDEPTKINRLLAAVQRTGFSLTQMDYELWVAYLKERRKNGDNDLNPLAGYFTPGFPEESTRRIFESSKTTNTLAAKGICHPDHSEHYLDANIQGMIQSGFLPQPPVPLKETT
jgi:thioester reductase-like protein